MENRGLLIVIAGPSGAGKGTICRELLRNYGENIELSISVTTRMPRDGEAEGVHYFFRDTEEFFRMAENGELIEFAKVHDNYYGTPKKYVMEKLEEGKNVILEIDVQGAMKVKDIFNEAVLIFVIPPTFADLKKRIEGRGTETQKDICKRLKNAYDEISHAVNYDYIIVNDDIKDAAEKINCILIAEKCRLSRCNIDFKKFREG
ncbi:MAG TPA: guanylate kinase [Bacillota bacterium]|nr:guanylate kinase [Bacillota bacterium]HQJ38298.1 guanylate kinase [Bacillota bacterium]